MTPRENRKSLELSGFTLTETLLGMAILLLIMSGIFTGFILSQRTIAQSSELSGNQTKLLILINALSDFERSCVIPYWDDPDPIANLEKNILEYKNGCNIAIDENLIAFSTPTETFALETPFAMYFSAVEQDETLGAYGSNLNIEISGETYSILIAPHSVPIARSADEE